MPLTEIQVDARPIAVARMFVGVAYLWCLLEVTVLLLGVADGKLAYPVWSALPLPSTRVVGALGMLGAVAGALLVLGILSTFVAGVSLLVLVAAQLLDQQTYSNHLLLCTLLLAYLILAKSGSRWGVDALIRRRRDTVPWWPQLLMMSQVSVCYFLAGLSKVNPRFLSGETLSQLMWLDAPDRAFSALAIATVATELFIGVGLWVRRVRPVAVLCGIGLHAGIIIGFDGGMFTFLAFALLCFSTYWMFLVRPPIGGASLTHST